MPGYYTKRRRRRRKFRRRRGGYGATSFRHSVAKPARMSLWNRSRRWAGRFGSAGVSAAAGGALALRGAGAYMNWRLKKLTRDNNAEHKIHELTWLPRAAITDLDDSGSVVPICLNALDHGNTATTRNGRSIKIIDMDMRMKFWPNEDADHQSYIVCAAIVLDRRSDGSQGIGHINNIWVDPGVRGTRLLARDPDNEQWEYRNRYKVLMFKRFLVGPTGVGDPQYLHYPRDMSGTDSVNAVQTHPPGRRGEKYIHWHSKRWIRTRYKEGASAGTYADIGSNALNFYIWALTPQNGSISDHAYTVDAVPVYDFEWRMRYVDN